ncbi:hypothetical protein E3N88_02471 [Mikania micrantha]|uniref:NPH3 domain-containing protein n=1 Tax=Mikania micrantha TaxID=192012 RepID=A0A5N6Q3V6_9ASTR|nr:hypothetical protein E3N88_02471 [Mikania micrantha]
MVSKLQSLDLELQGVLQWLPRCQIWWLQPRMVEIWRGGLKKMIKDSGSQHSAMLVAYRDTDSCWAIAYPSLVKERLCGYLGLDLEIWFQLLSAWFILRNLDTISSIFRYVAAELATDIVVNVGNIKFHLHKFPLLSKSARFQNMLANSDDENANELEMNDIPGGPGAFEICAKFCYGMTVTLNAYNVVSARCAAEYLEMHESVEKGNLVYKTEVFLDSSIFKTWKDSIIVFRTAKSFIPWSEELKVVNRCLDSISSKTSMDPSRVEWSYTYNRKKIPNENGAESPLYNGVRKQLTVPNDWWVEDLCDLHIDLYKRVIITIKAKGKVSLDVVGESLKAYLHRRLKKNGRTSGDDIKNRLLIETIVFLLPTERNSVSCDLLFQLLQECIRLDFGETEKDELVKRIGQQLQNVSVADLVDADVDLVQKLVKIFMMQDQIADHGQHDFLEVKFVDSGAKVKVAKLIDGYLAEIARNPNVPLSKFTGLADMVSTLPRSSHDGMYRAIDMKLSADACMHAIQNERLPLRVVVQILYFEQMRVSTIGSSRSATTNTEEEWDSVPTSEELKTLKGELACLKMNEGGKSIQKSKGMHLMSSRILSRLFSGKDPSDNESSDTSESPCSTSARETKATKHENIIRLDWNGINVLLLNAAQPAALDIGLVPESDNSIKSAKFLYLMGADDVNLDKLLKDAFVVYQGPHGDKGVYRANVILPGAAVSEKELTRTQKGQLNKLRQLYQLLVRYRILGHFLRNSLESSRSSNLCEGTIKCVFPLMAQSEQLHCHAVTLEGD